MNIKACTVCGNKATRVFVNGHKARSYSLCEDHFKAVCLVRVVATQHVKNIKRINRRNIALDDEKYCGVRFIFLFKEVASLHEGKLHWLTNIRFSAKSVFIYKDERSAAEYLIDNPPVNAHGNKFQSFNEFGGGHGLSLANNHFKDRGRYASSAVPLGEAYNILQKRRSTKIYLSGKNGIATK